MRVNLRSSGGVQFRVLSDEQCEEIRLAALEVLEGVGVRFYEPEAVDILKKAGCTVSEGLLVRFPCGLVEEALNTVPSRFTLYRRTGEPAMKIEPNRVYFGPGPTCPNFIDPSSGKRRPFVKRDAALTARICETLPNIDYVMSLGSINDVPPDKADVHEFAAMVGETTKPIMSWSFSLDSLDKIYRMCAIVKGSEEACVREPFMIFYAEPSSPLKQTAEAVQKLLYCARRRIPLVYTPCILAGATGPATLAGMLVQNAAETLAGVVLSQLVRKGTPLVVGGVLSVLDMRTAILSYGAPELSLLSAAMTEVARRMGLPVFSTAGCTDAKCLDEQASAEAAISILLAVFSGANFVHDVGYVESAMTGSLEQLVMCDELIGLARYIARGIRVDSETLALEAIREARETGEYLTLDHTVRNFREQFWFPRLMDRRRWGEWVKAGRKTMGDRVRDMLHGLLKERHAEPLAADVTARLHRIAPE
jgi:trimethylamine--corrinoid protein Co-methyltransferase